MTGSSSSLGDASIERSNVIFPVFSISDKEHIGVTTQTPGCVRLKWLLFDFLPLN